MKKGKANYIVILEQNVDNFKAIEELADKVDVNIIDSYAIKNSITTFKGSLDAKQVLDSTT